MPRLIARIELGVFMLCWRVSAGPRGHVLCQWRLLAGLQLCGDRCKDFLSEYRVVSLTTFTHTQSPDQQHYVKFSLMILGKAASVFECDSRSSTVTHLELQSPP